MKRKLSPSYNENDALFELSSSLYLVTPALVKVYRNSCCCCSRLVQLDLLHLFLDVGGTFFIETQFRLFRCQSQGISTTLSESICDKYRDDSWLLNQDFFFVFLVLSKIITTFESCFEQCIFLQPFLPSSVSRWLKNWSVPQTWRITNIL